MSQYIYVPFLVLMVMIALQSLGAPLHTKHVPQDVAGPVSLWKKACLAAGGEDKCHHISFTAANTVISSTRPCGLQDSADALMDFAKALEDDDMMKSAQYFAFQARGNDEHSLCCQDAPNNAELAELFQCQLQGADPNWQTFIGLVACPMFIVAAVIRFWRETLLKSLGDVLSAIRGVARSLAACIQTEANATEEDSSDSGSDSGDSAASTAAETTTTPTATTPRPTPTSPSQAWDAPHTQTMDERPTIYVEEFTMSEYNVAHRGDGYSACRMRSTTTSIRRYTRVGASSM